MLTRAKSTIYLAAALIASGSRAADGGNVMRFEAEGVTLEISSQEDRVVFCVRAKENVKISAMYGVTFDADSAERKQWDETLPKTVTGEGWDFDLPLRVDLKTRSSFATRRIRVQLGACSDHCEIVKFDIQIPSYNKYEIVDVKCFNQS